MSLEERRKRLLREENLKPLRFSDAIYFDDKDQFRLAQSKDDNIITLKNKIDYTIQYLRGNISGNKGSNIVLKLINSEDDYAPLIMKICLYDIDDKWNRNWLNLFKREVKALRLAKEKGAKKVIHLIEDGSVYIGDYQHQYYVMEYANDDLCNYLLKSEIPIQQKIVICNDLLRGLKELHDIDIYHRDIKHDNLLICNTQCKLADLGLVKFRHDDYPEFGKRLGAYGWESPEAINKYYTEREADKDSYSAEDDCIVDSKSDVFQLGKVFWYIFTGQIPIGQLKESDLQLLNESNEDSLIIFEALKKMLHQDKHSRVDLNEAINQFNSITKRFNVS